MSYSALNAVDESKITRLGFKAEPCNYVYATPDNLERAGKIYEIDDLTYTGIIKILEGNELHNISKGDKVFVLPGHPLSISRLKEYFKKIGATLTKNIDNATIVIGNKNFSTKVDWHTQAKFVHIMIECEQIYKIVNNVPEDIEITYGKITTPDSIDKTIPTYLSAVLGRYIVYSDSNIERVDSKYLITPLALDVIYNVLSKKLKVVTFDKVSDEANSELKLEDEETYISICNMLQSNDTNNVNLGLNILFHCDLKGEIRYNVWRLAKNYFWKINNSINTKTKTYFLERTEFEIYQRMSNDEFLIKASEEKFLNQKILNDLMPEVIDNEKDTVENYVNSNFYDKSFLENGDIVLSLKECWKQVETI